ncbi:hypothetical protein Tco_0999817, partial [Tanacetum coccineum]
RFRCEADALWVQVVKAIHGEQGDGRNTQFWNDAWIEDQPLKSKFPILFALEMEKDVSVANKIEQGMDFSLFRRHRRGGPEREQWEVMQNIIMSTCLSPMEDRWVWSLDGTGIFYVASARILIDKMFLITSGEATRWCKLTPIKVNILA